MAEAPLAVRIHELSTEMRENASPADHAVLLLTDKLTRIANLRAALEPLAAQLTKLATGASDSPSRDNLSGIQLLLASVSNKTQSTAERTTNCAHALTDGAGNSTLVGVAATLRGQADSAETASHHLNEADKALDSCLGLVINAIASLDRGIEHIGAAAQVTTGVAPALVNCASTTDRVVASLST